MKTIAFKPLWKLRPDYLDLVANPPAGYMFIHQTGSLEKSSIALNKTKWAFPLLESVNHVIPMHLMRSFGDRFSQQLGVDLVYAVMRLFWRQDPWIVDFLGEQPHVIVGSERLFALYKPLVKRALTSPACKKIIYDVNAGKQALLQILDMPELAPKIAVINPSTPAKNFTKPPSTGQVKLLFVGSATIDNSNQFETKGGRILLDAFVQLREQYDNVELVVRSKVPPDVRKDYSGIPNLKIIEDILPHDQLEKEFIGADIFVAPVHTVPSKTLVQAMSYELPVITTDVWSSSELIDDGRTGLLIHHPTAHMFTDGSIVHFDSHEYRTVLSSKNNEMAKALVEKIGLLINNPDLRSKMGRAARWEVENGRFSTQQRNKDLKKVLDEATA